MFRPFWSSLPHLSNSLTSCGAETNSAMIPGAAVTLSSLALFTVVLDTIKPISKRSPQLSNIQRVMAALLLAKPFYSLFFAWLLITILYSSPATADPLYTVCGNYTTNSAFQSNLNSLLSSLSSNTPASGYANATTGSIPDRVYGLALCRGDLNASACGSCVDRATQDIMQLCPYERSAMIWYDGCHLRYSNQPFFSSIDTQQCLCMCNNRNTTEPRRFRRLLGDLMSNIFSWARYNSSGALFATGEVKVRASEAIYGLAQCTRDLSAEQCYQCLQEIIRSNCCFGKIGGRFTASSCIYRFADRHFYAGTSNVVLASPPDANATAPAGAGNKKNKNGLVLGITIPAAVALVAACILCICFCRRRSTKKLPHEAHSGEIESIESLILDLSILKVATANFSESNKLGQGGFGAVYKGLLPDGQEIAVKRLSRNSRQGLGELKNELVLVAKLQHRNLVRLLGVCLDEQEKLLVYEYVPNRSLDTFLFDPTKSGELYWERRYQIIEGIARGLLYLHEDSQLKIVHRDLKASNILLDANMNPKISDFGLARLFGENQTRSTTSRVVGTFGYMAPEYVKHGRFSIKSDVYSFGVLVLEIVTGRKNSGFVHSEEDKDLISHIWDHWTNGTEAEIIDPSLEEHCLRSEVVRCIQIGLLCLQKDPAERPSMSSIVVMLNSHSMTLEAPTEPAFYMGGSTHEQFTSANAIQMSQNEVSNSELEGR